MAIADSTEQRKTTYTDEELDWIQEALLIGLSEHGECERVRDRITVLEVCNESVPKDLLPLHPTGTADVIGKFANALVIVSENRRGS